MKKDGRWVLLSMEKRKVKERTTAFLLSSTSVNPWKPEETPAPRPPSRLTQRLVCVYTHAGSSERRVVRSPRSAGRRSPFEKLEDTYSIIYIYIRIYRVILSIKY